MKLADVDDRAALRGAGGKAPGGRHSHVDLDEARRAHRRIAEGITAGDETGAEQAMTKHLSAFEAVVGEHGILDAPIFDSQLP